MFDIENSYWNNNGKFQKEYEELAKIIPNVGWSENNDIYIDLLTSASNIYYKFYNDGDADISEYNGNKLNECLEDYNIKVYELLEDKEHYKEIFWYINSEEMLEDFMDAIIQIGIKEKLSKAI